MIRNLLICIASGAVVALGAYLLMETFELLDLDLGGRVILKIPAFVVMLAVVSIGSALLALVLRRALAREDQRAQ